MPEIEITPEQEERLRALQEEIARDVVGKYGHVRPRDAVEYLLDRYEADDETPDVDAAATDGAAAADTETDGESETDDETATDGEASADTATDSDSEPDSTSNGETSDATARVVGDDGETGEDDAMLNEMMSLLDTHDDKWGESS
ncbi:MAG: hypothetical protein ABEI80_02665, partial [Haloplanus sp.]